MEYLSTLPQWSLALLIFMLRIVDVSVGTMRTIAVVRGRIKVSVLLGFIEVLLWLFAVSQVLLGVTQNAYLLLAYAGGFAAGNAVGIMLERRVALGDVVLRIILHGGGEDLADALRSRARRVVRFHGLDMAGSVTLLYVLCRRREVSELLGVVRGVDGNFFYAVEPLSDWSSEPVGTTGPLPYPTGWRARFKMK